MYGAVAPLYLLVCVVLAGEGRAVGFSLSGGLGVFHADVLCGADGTVFVVSAVFNIAADRLLLRSVRHSHYTPV